MPSVFALDASATSTGWGFGSTDARPVGAVHRFAPKGAPADEVWAKATIWMNEQMKVLQPDVVAIEAPIMSSNPGQGGFTNPATQGMLWGLQATLRTVVYLRKGRPAILVNAASARKLLTGRGTYEKGQAKAAVKRRCMDLGWADEASTFDLCDAYCVWAFAAASVDKDFAANFAPLMARAA